MINSHQNWLSQLDADSKSKQSEFIHRIAQRLGRKVIQQKPLHPYRGAPGFWNDFTWSAAECLDQFTQNFESAGGYVARFQHMSDVKLFIIEKAIELEARYILRQHVPELAALDLEASLPNARVSVWNSSDEDDWQARAAEADIGIVTADYAVACTGSITVLSAKEKGRSVSLLPTILFVVLPLERLKTRLGEILEQFDSSGAADLPAGIHFISGPSRSADIENDLTIGVHGPGIVYTLIVG